MAGYRRPTTPAARAKADAAREAKLADLHTQLHDQVQALRSGDDWRRWLDVAARFRTYSFNNTLLIYAQRLDATTVAGFTAWQALGRQVDKGQRGIQILAPVTHRPTSTTEQGTATAAPVDGQGNGRGGPRRVVGYRVAYVWDLSQTSGEPLPDRPRPQLLTGQAPDGLWDTLAAQVTAAGYTLERGDCGGAGDTAVNGWTNFATRTVRVRGDVDDAHAARTLAHELAHVLLHDPAATADGARAAIRGAAAETSTADCRGVQEVEAESLAYLVATSAGLDTGGYTFPYVAGWAGSVNGTEPEAVVRDTGTRVLRAATTVLAALEHDTTDVDEPLAARIAAGADRTAALLERAEQTHSLATTPTPTVDVAALLAIHQQATVFYTDELAGHHDRDPAAARAFLAERGIAAQADNYSLGYAPPAWTALVDHLRAAGHTDNQLLASGLAMATTRGTIVDRFRDRVMFPIHDTGTSADHGAGGQVVAFLGRSLDPAAGRDGEPPRYLNSPDTPLYRKREHLYGLGPEQVAALRAGAVPVLVEGPVDALAITHATAGVARPHIGIAPCGTALTAAQVERLDQVLPLAGRTMVEAFDQDTAGRSAALRAYPLLRAAGAWPVSAQLPVGHDPASLAQTVGRVALAAAVDVNAAAAHPLVDAVIDHRLTRWVDRLRWVEGRVGAARDVAPFIAGLPADQIARQVARLAERHGLPTDLVTVEVTDAVSRSDAWGRLQNRELRPGSDARSPATVTAAARSAVDFPRGMPPTKPADETPPALALATSAAPAVRARTH